MSLYLCPQIALELHICTLTAGLSHLLRFSTAENALSNYRCLSDNSSEKRQSVIHRETLIALPETWPLCRIFMSADVRAYHCQLQIEASCAPLHAPYRPVLSLLNLQCYFDR